MAKQIKATTTTLPSSHVAMLSHPKEVAKVIEDAAAGKKLVRTMILFTWPASEIRLRAQTFSSEIKPAQS